MLDRLAVAALLAGCNQIYGLDPTTVVDAGPFIDLDLDGVADSADRCLAPVRDEMDDLDADGVRAKDDPCPMGVGSANADGDALPDVCDPFPSAGGDRLRCYMSFGSTELNARLWKLRGTATEWTSREGELYAGIPANDVTSGFVSTLDLEVGKQTTFETFVALANGIDAGPYAFRVWARAADAPNNAELGCEISGNAGSVRLAVVRGDDMDIAATTVMTGFPLTVDGVLFRLTIAPSGAGADIRCTFEWNNFAARSAKAHVDQMVPGRFAFGTQNLAANVAALAIYDRDDVQPLP